MTGGNKIEVEGPRAPLRIVVVDDFEKLADRQDGTLRVTREIAKVAGKKG